MYCTLIRTACLAAVAALLLASPSTSSACWPYDGFGGGYGYGIWNNASFYNGGIYASPLPYYAQFPPVYYSHQITARHYGASPYAWSAGQEPITFVPQPEPRSVAMPLMIDNPFVGGAKPAAAQAGLSENPFVVSSR